MKKEYCKPEIVFENFSLSTNIAAGCETQVTATVGSCAVEFIPGVMTIFVSGVSACTTSVEDGSKDYNYLCYHNPTPSNNVFTS